MIIIVQRVSAIGDFKDWVFKNQDLTPQVLRPDPSGAVFMGLSSLFINVCSG